MISKTIYLTLPYPNPILTLYATHVFISTQYNIKDEKYF